ncbi:hypothetical protein M2451_000549 [Dysgonomonas sp. PFB1-18]|uniref:hypothetical protein n=1 Tax=unclassified Dysgonomonas TaxID=2630389 RepID=UPI002474DD28|nr:MULTISPECIES: hypothetical protein [unclassified Dysgonomonas]MDH6307400.1 hypothetical protein [Dysgonomonas sp. PF1-14]MDH6337318.1 hypothetical protein [Dysgonomonas sp. PF1-16]MDH6379242.1 hypothetical protein [Dysgonomonas sp. PFB1-18]MDH6396120.1 hypothetical protein [Dysgonomonas sp. PF1-23]
MESKQTQGVNVQVIDISKATIDGSDSGIKQCKVIGLIFNGIGLLFITMFILYLMFTIVFYFNHKDDLKNIHSIEKESYKYEYKLEFIDREVKTIISAVTAVVFIVLGSILQIIAFNAKNAAIANNLRYTMLVEINALNQKISS